MFCPDCNEELVLANQEGELTCINQGCGRDKVNRSVALTESEVDSKYEECDCGSEKMRVYYANEDTCLVVECAVCGETVTSLQASPPGHTSISPADDPRVR